jgi:hypothetical protein
MRAVDALSASNGPQLIPLFKKPERKLLSIAMAVLDIVPSFRSEVLSQVGYGSGKTCQYQSFMEPHFESPKLPKRYPDGLIVCTRGQSMWSAFIEAKAEGNRIRPDQIQEYAELANALNIDSIISISNEYAYSPTELPYHLASNKRRGRSVFHLSWPGLRSALRLHCASPNGCNPAEQSVMASALEYMESDRSGVQTFNAMSPDWPNFVESANTALGFTANTSGLMEIVYAWQQERRDLCTKLNDLVGGDVELRHPMGARATPEEFTVFDRKFVSDNYQLKAGYFFKKSKCKLHITADLRACSQIYVLEFQPPANKKAKASVTWLAKTVASLANRPYRIGIEWPGRYNDTVANIDEFVRFADLACEGHKDPPRAVAIIAQHRNVRRFKSRKQFIEDLEQNALCLIEEAKRIGIVTT